MTMNNKANELWDHLEKRWAAIRTGQVLPKHRYWPYCMVCEGSKRAFGKTCFDCGGTGLDAAGDPERSDRIKNNYQQLMATVGKQ